MLRRWLKRDKTDKTNAIAVEVAEQLIKHFLNEVKDDEETFKNDSKEEQRQHYVLEMQNTLHHATFGHSTSFEYLGLVPTASNSPFEHKYTGIQGEQAKRWIQHFFDDNYEPTAEDEEILRLIFTEVKQRLIKEYQRKWTMKAPEGWDNDIPCSRCQPIVEKIGG